MKEEMLSYLVRWNNFTNRLKCVISMFLWISKHRRAWVSRCENCTPPQMSSLFCPSGMTRIGFLKQDYMVVPVLRIFSCRQECFCILSTVEDMLYRHCDYRTEAQEPWRFQSTQGRTVPPHRVNPFCLLITSSDTQLYFHFLNVGFKKYKKRERDQSSA